LLGAEILIAPHQAGGRMAASGSCAGCHHARTTTGFSLSSATASAKMRMKCGQAMR
jgi:hypothetical protein